MATILLYSVIMDVQKYKTKLANGQILAQNGHCRLWRGTSKDCSGTTYGTIYVLVSPGHWRNLYPHRLALQFDRGWTLEYMDSGKDQVPKMVVSHLCHNARCVYPPHLSWETETVNGSRAYCVHAGTCTGAHEAYPDCLLHLRI